MDPLATVRVKSNNFLHLFFSGYEKYTLSFPSAMAQISQQIAPVCHKIQTPRLMTEKVDANFVISVV
jgi:hypothetical protein